MKPKRILALLLALMMCLTLCACGGRADISETEVPEESTTAELVASTPFLDLDKLWSDMASNKAKATLSYDQQMFQVKVTVLNISTAYFDYRYKYNGYIKSLRVYLPTETLAELTNGEYITVLGKLVISGSDAELKDAFVVDDSMVEKQTLDDETVQYIIDNYTPYNPDTKKIDWQKGSCPFLIDNRSSFEKLTAETFLDAMDGEWRGKQYVTVEDDWRITITSTSTADVTKNGGEVHEWEYGFVEGLLKFPVSANYNYDARKVSDRLIVLYQCTIDYVPYWILYKE